MTDVSYVPGDRTAIAGDRCWLLIDAAPDSAATREIWQRIREDASLEGLMASLLRIGFAGLPSFALLAAGDGRFHLICRGRGSATLISGGPAERVDGAGLATWREHPVAADVASVVLGDPPAGTDLQLPASAGIFLAQSVTVVLTAAGSGPGPVTVPAAWNPREPAVPEPASRAAWVPPGPAAPAPASRPGMPDPEPMAAAPGAGAGSDTLTYSAADDCVPAGAVPPAPGTAGGDASGAASGGPAEDTGYDFLFAATQARTVEDAAVRPADDDADGLPSLVPAMAWEPPPPPAPGAPAHAGPVPAEPGGQAGAAMSDGHPGSGGLIEAVPWASGPGEVQPAGIRAVPAPPAVTPSGLEAGDGATVKRSDLPRPTSGPPLLPDRIGPTVHALLCPSSHANPPSSAQCRVCGLALLQHDPVTVPRPVLGVLKLSTGDVITLDRGVVMGRSPRTDFEGEERPHIVKLPGGDGEISRTHLQVSLDGWYVLVTDLKSTNGTLVTLPGRDPERLRPHEPLPIQPGTIVTLADGINFRYEVTP